MVLVKVEGRWKYVKIFIYDPMNKFRADSISNSAYKEVYMVSNAVSSHVIVENTKNYSNPKILHCQ